MVGSSFRYLLLAFAAGFFPAVAFAQDDVSLFNYEGKAEAYVALDEELTIYLWSGKPVAYLEADDAGGFHVYGFNGKHLGWFVKGVIWDHGGKAACATEDAIQSPQFEPFKSFKQFVPFKSFKQFAPFRPYFSSTFGDTPCRFLLGAGSK
jgi:hypothetical protein